MQTYKTNSKAIAEPSIELFKFSYRPWKVTTTNLDTLATEYGLYMLI